MVVFFNWCKNIVKFFRNQHGCNMHFKSIQNIVGYVLLFDPAWHAAAYSKCFVSLSWIHNIVFIWSLWSERLATQQLPGQWATRCQENGFTYEGCCSFEENYRDAVVSQHSDQGLPILRGQHMEILPEFYKWAQTLANFLDGEMANEKKLLYLRKKRKSLFHIM